ncbi:cold shock domain-containing protein [Ruegeria sp. SCPT10]|uniref:cold-shock protein n=1 Tax=Ruegeria sp. SCP10 TaxID=3141377 RepID=UPI0033384D88
MKLVTLERNLVLDGSTIGGDATLRHIEGTLKWFSAMKGYGFVTCNVSGEDALMHQNALHDFGQTSIANGCTLEAFASVKQRGLQIVEILSIRSEASWTVPHNKQIGLQPIKPTSMLPARVRWFCKEKNYGFVNVFDDTRDCFLQTNVLEKAGLGSVDVGEALCVEVIDRSGGRVVVSVRPWT